MSTNKTAAVFLKEMGITEWQLRDHLAEPDSDQAVVLTSKSAVPIAEAPLETPVSASQGMWWFYGDQPAGETELLFQNMLRALGLSQQQWSWKKLGSKFNESEMPPENSPLVAIALGVRATQALTGERESLAELRGAILTISQEGAEDIPVIATFDLVHLLARPKDKMLVWQDLLLAKSVLQSF
jgi:DNA polymerase